MIEIENLTKSFGSLQVLKGVNLTIGKGEVISIVGSSGAGKTTLLQLIGTLDKPTGGTIRFNGEDLGRMNSKRLAAFRNKHIGFVFQHCIIKSGEGTGDSIAAFAAVDYTVSGQ